MTPKERALEALEDLITDRYIVGNALTPKGFDDSIETIRVALTEPEWQPIETAPPYMDIITITKIALAYGYYEPEVLHHNEFIWYKKDGTRTFGTPTHWMPLPTPPTKKESE